MSLVTVFQECLRDFYFVLCCLSKPDRLFWWMKLCVCYFTANADVKSCDSEWNISTTVSWIALKFNHIPLQDFLNNTCKNNSIPTSLRFTLYIPLLLSLNFWLYILNPISPPWCLRTGRTASVWSSLAARRLFLRVVLLSWRHTLQSVDTQGRLIEW